MIRNALILLVLCSSTFGATALRYVRDGASGAGTGLNWTDALDDLPATLLRDAIYYTADGGYAGYIFDDAPDGTKVTEVRKATEADHGTETGWSSAYGDGQADFAGTFYFRTDYIKVNGSFRNESNWGNLAGYGMKCDRLRTSSSEGDVGHHNTVQYVACPRTYVTTHPGGDLDERVYLGGFTETVTFWTVSHCFLANSEHTIVQLAGATDVTLEYNYYGASWGKEAIRGQGTASRIIIRHSTFVDASQIDPGDGTSGITAEVALWDFDVAQTGNEFYGNTVSNSKSGGRNSIVVIGGDENATGWVGPGSHNSKVYNNTFAGIADSPSYNPIVLHGDNTEAKNNLFHEANGSGVTADTASNNVTTTSDPFLDYVGFDLRITEGSEAQDAGTSIAGADYANDRNATARGADGTWDAGAFEVEGEGGGTSGGGGGSSTINAATLRVGSMRTP